MSKRTSPCQFDRIVTAYESLTLVYMNTVLKKDNSVKNGMLSSMGVAVAGPAQSSGAGFVYLLQDMHGGRDEPGLQEKYGAISKAEKARCDWLQSLANRFLLYHMEK